VDARYTSQSSIASGPTSKLPSWIKEQLIIATGNFGEVHKQIHHFFRKKQGVM
jgi:chromosome transmission fidelity protein 1